MLPEILELMSVERIVPTTEGPFLLCDVTEVGKHIRPKDHVWNAKS
jgi:hypothetical protein